MVKRRKLEKLITERFHDNEAYDELSFLLTGIPDLAATFREPWSYLQIELTDENDWNCYIDAGDIMLEFLTTRATGVLVFAKGPISGDFMQIKLLGKTRARATMNLGMKCKIT